MKRAALIFNPASGQRSRRRMRFVVERSLERLRAAGVEAEAWPTCAPGDAARLAQRAVDEGFDTVIACGGDGTIHDILQALAGSNVQLGVAPMGTANALACNLGLGSSPVRAVERLLQARPLRVPVARLRFRDWRGQEAERLFTVAAGLGADAFFLSRLDAGQKRRWGYLAYITEAFRIWALYSFPLFEAAITPLEGGEPRRMQLSQLFAVRIRDFGGLLHELAPGASLLRDSLTLIAFRGRRRRDFFFFFMAAILRRHSFRGGVELLEAEAVELRSLPGAGAEICVEADGEALGTLPARLERTSLEITLLVPPGARP